MELKFGKMMGAATVLSLSSALMLGSVQLAAAGTYGSDEETTEGPVSAPAAPAAVVTEEEEGFLGDWIPGTIGGSITLISDYSFRGVSQTQRDFALQGGVTYKPWAGLYIGAWGSSINFVGDDTYLEQDFFAGWASSIGDFSYDVGATFLWYPAEEHWNYWEFALKTSYNLGFMTPKLAVVWSPNYFGFADDGIYASTGLAVPIPIPENKFVALTVDGNFGYTWTDDAEDGDNLFVSGDGSLQESYMDWNVGLVVAVHKNVSVDLRYVDTDLHIGNDGEGRFVGGATFSF